MGRISRLIDALWRWFPYKDSFTIWPFGTMLANILLAGLLSSLATNEADPDWMEQSQAMIGLVSSASITIVTLTFSLTVLSVQVASQTYSPRLLDDFVKDATAKVVISVNLGAYVYCYTLLYFLKPSSPTFPMAAVQLLTVHLAAILLSFVNFIHFFINGFRIEKILERALDTSLAAARTLNHMSEGEQETLPVPSSSYKVLADKSGYVVSFALKPLTKLAQKMDLCIRYNHQIGEFVNEGAVLCYVWDAQTREDQPPLEERIAKHLRNNFRASQQALIVSQSSITDVHRQVEATLGVFASTGVVLSKKRAGELDVTLGIQQLVDIAMRALSPAVNDPHTAVQCMDVLSMLLATLARMDMGIPNAVDEDGHVRLCAPRRSFAHLTSMTESIRRYGASDLVVLRRGLRLFGDLGSILVREGRLDRVPAVLAQLEQWMFVSEQTFADDSPELVSLRELYEHLLQNMADSDSLILKTATSRDLQEFEITHREETTDSSSIRKAHADGTMERHILGIITELLRKPPVEAK